jgi:RimJ/RimL family protein N-acetyltransferase
MSHVVEGQSGSAQPVGPLVDVTSAQKPGPVVLEGHFGRVEKLDPSLYAADLWRALSGEDWVWTYMFYGPFSDRATFSSFLGSITTLENHFYYAIINQDGQPMGWASLMEIRPSARVIEIGSIVYSPILQRTPLATEAQYLLARYVFETLGYRRYEWKCDALNASSRRAAQRFGFTFEGIFRQHMIVKGRSRDTAWFAMLDSEWPLAKVAFEQWLDPKNFDSEGRQRRKLEEIRNTL